MPLYTYEAFDKAGAMVRGEFEAKGKEVIIAYLESKRLTPVRIEEKGSYKTVEERFFRFRLFQRVTQIDRILLVRNLGAVIKAGLSILEALDILIRDTSKAIMRDILMQVKMSVLNGQPLSRAFSPYKKYFPGIFIGMLKAGEESGQLEKTLAELNNQLSREYELVRRVRSALAYPIVLIIASILVVTLLLLFVLPRLVKVFKKSGTELPFLTKILVAISDAITSHPYVDGIIIFSLIAFFLYFRKTTVGRALNAFVFIRTPFVKEVIKKVTLARFTRILGSLIASGMSIVEALNLASETINQYLYKNAISHAAQEMRKGIALSKILENYPDLFPRLLLGLLVVGEKTGTLEFTLKTFADFYDEEVEHVLKNLTVFIEPVLLLFMGLIIGSIAFSILLPIYQLVGEFV